MLAAHGDEGATTQKIAELAGVNEVTFFRRYGSKASLYERIINERLATTPLSMIVYIIQRYQAQGLLRDESPVACLGALLGPIMVNQMARRDDFGLPIPEIDAQGHVDGFLHGRKRGE